MKHDIALENLSDTTNMQHIESLFMQNIIFKQLLKCQHYDWIYKMHIIL